MTHVLVTGATGFIGKPLVSYLAAEGFTVTALVRKAEEKPTGASAIKIVPDIVGAKWKGVFSGVDVVVHLAGRAHIMKEKSKDSLEAFRAANREPTLEMAAAAAAQGVKRFVFISSVKSSVDHTSIEGVDESVDLAPGSPYGISKLEAELGLLPIMRDTGLQIVILRPTLVYGAGVKANFNSLIKLVKLGIPLPLGGIENRRSMLGLSNLLSAIQLAILSPKVVGRAFFLADDEPLSTPQLLREIGIALKRKVRLITVNTRILREAAELVHQRDKLDRLVESLVVSSAAFRAATGWETKPMQWELERVVASLQSEKKTKEKK